jgi:hypothetical protein
MIADVLGRVLVRLIRRVGITTLLSLILLGLAIGIVANGLAGMIRNLDSGPFWLVITGGLLFGWLLAKSRLPGWLAGLAAVVLGAGLLFIQVGRLELKLISAVRVYLHLSGEIWWAAKISPHHLNTIDTTQLDQAIHPLVDGFKVLFLRTSHWCEALVAGRASYDPIAVALVWGCGLPRFGQPGSYAAATGYFWVFSQLVECMLTYCFTLE